VVPKLSLGSGLVYVYTKPADQPSGADGWYLTALDFRTGATRWRKLTGEGLGFNNNYAPVTIGPDGTAYIGTLGGLVAVRDGTPPPQGLGGRRALIDDRLDGTKPRVRMRLTRLKKKRVRVSIGGADAAHIARVDLKLGNRSLGSDRSAPFGRTISLLHVSRKRAHALRAVVTLDDGTHLRLKRVLRAR
jgi:hypothetical protein